MARPRKQPAYDENRSYPARDAGSARDLRPYLDKLRRTLDGVNRVLDDPDATEHARRSALLEGARVARAQVDDVAHLVVEWAMKGSDGLTMKQAADAIGVNADTTYRWWHNPLSTDVLAAEWQEQGR